MRGDAKSAIYRISELHLTIEKSIKIDEGNF